MGEDYEIIHDGSYTMRVKFTMYHSGTGYNGRPFYVHIGIATEYYDVPEWVTHSGSISMFKYAHHLYELIGEEKFCSETGQCKNTREAHSAKVLKKMLTE